MPGAVKVTAYVPRVLEIVKVEFDPTPVVLFCVTP